MPRKGPAAIRQPVASFIWQSRLVGRLIGMVTRRGKRSVAERMVYGALQSVGERTGQNPLDVLAEAMNNVMPTVEVRARRVGGQSLQVPVEVRAERKIAVTFRWLIREAGARPGKTFVGKLADEIIDASKGTGGAVKRRDDVRKMAEANKAFAHYRW